jgi:hypothetical protein
MLQSSLPNRGHKNTEANSESSNVVIPDFDDLSSRYCLKDKHPFQSFRHSSIGMFCSKRKKFRDS